MRASPAGAGAILPLVRRRLALLLALLVTCGLLAAQRLVPQTPPPGATLRALQAPPAEPPPGEGEPTNEGTPTPPPAPTALTNTPATISVAGRDVAGSALIGGAGPLFALPPLAPLLGGELRLGPGGAGWVLKTGDVETVFGPGSTVATVGRTILQLPQPVVGGEAGPWVPLELLKRSFGESLHWDIAWDAASRRLVATPQQRRVVPVEWSLVHMQGLTTLVLQFPEAPRVNVQEKGQRVEVTMLGDQVAQPSRPPEVVDSLVQSLRFADDKILLDVAPGAVVEHYQQQDPYRLVFDVYQRVAAAPGTPTPPQRPTIVIDPGHGGVETGAIGPSGTQEKELTLLLAQGLARELQQRLPVDVELTRDEDAELPLDTRAAIANQHRAKLFISIHLNSSVGTGATGAETYFLSLEASDARAAAAARAENVMPPAAPGAATPGGPDAQGASSVAGLDLILWDLAQSQHLAESQRFASIVQEELNTALGLRNRGVKQAPFRVLMGAAMPAVLVELGFISNPEEEKKLLTVEYRQQLVDALVRAVSRYQAQGRPDAAPDAQAAIR
ncbi:MAG TPA: N-acetylmuramoyl-L-alanine amidase [Thermoanaerobaculia bacterium]|jgi:N-acetylmuramoyl-L-alanine amidase|nr:N-acetylmuramoyl-L-alanine amidase [Thermoanaerobaculia bacterium]